MTRSATRARSSTCRASGPIWVRPSCSAPIRGKWPVFGTRPRGGFQAGHATPGRGEANAPAAVAPDAERRRARSDERAFAAAARARTTRGRRGIARGTVEIAAIPGRRLRHDDRAGRTQPRHDGRVCFRSPVSMTRALARARKPHNVDPVLDRDRHPVQRSDRRRILGQARGRRRARLRARRRRRTTRHPRSTRVPTRAERGDLRRPRWRLRARTDAVGDGGRTIGTRDSERLLHFPILASRGRGRRSGSARASQLGLDRVLGTATLDARRLAGEHRAGVAVFHDGGGLRDGIVAADGPLRDVQLATACGRGGRRRRCRSRPLQSAFRTWSTACNRRSRPGRGRPVSGVAFRAGVTRIARIANHGCGRFTRMRYGNAADSDAPASQTIGENREHR